MNTKLQQEKSAIPSLYGHFNPETGAYTSLSDISTPNAILTLLPPFGKATGIEAIEEILVNAAGRDTTAHVLTW